MTSRFIPFGTLLLAVTALSACNPAAGTAEAGKAAPAADAPSAAAASASGLPSCDEVGRLDPAVGASVTTTCEIALSGVDAGSSFKVELISGNVTEAGMP
nr:hypothetical protein [Hyphomonadaceae bacterium]